MCLCAIRMSLVCARMSSVRQSYLIRMSLVCTRIYPYVTRMYSYVIRMSLICTRMSSLCHSYVICMSLICTRMSSLCHSYVCTRILYICHSYVLVCHQYVTRMYSYVIRMSLVCGFTMNLGRKTPENITQKKSCAKSCCLNTHETTLHRKNYRDSRQNCTHE